MEQKRILVLMYAGTAMLAAAIAAMFILFPNDSRLNAEPYIENYGQAYGMNAEAVQEGDEWQEYLENIWQY